MSNTSEPDYPQPAETAPVAGDPRVSTLELFFGLVFVFTLVQLASDL